MLSFIFAQSTYSTLSTNQPYILATLLIPLHRALIDILLYALCPFCPKHETPNTQHAIRNQ